MFDGQVNFYALRHGKLLDELKEKMKIMMATGNLLQVELYYVFPYEKLYTKKNTVKQLDSTNRQKSAEDAVSKLIGIDDSNFIRVTSERVIQCKLLGANEVIHARITPFKSIRTWTEIQASLTSQPN